MSISSNHFYYATTRKYIALFGTLFNKISVTRTDNTGTQLQQMYVPISYGPYQKFLARVNQDPNLNRKTAITLPRMAFEITKFEYDGTRKVNSINKINAVSQTDPNSSNFMYSPTPFNIDFNLYVMVEYADDGAQIVEQILPFFKPDWTTTVKLIDNLPSMDIPLVLREINMQDLYEGNFETRRALMWVLNFTMKCWYFGPNRNKKVIKFIDNNIYSAVGNLSPDTIMEIQPGLTVNGTPTSNVANSIPYSQINIGDNWGTVIIIQENTG